MLNRTATVYTWYYHQTLFVCCQLGSGGYRDTCHHGNCT